MLLAEKNKPIFRTYEDFPYEDLCTYAGLDCIVTSELLSQVWEKLNEEPQYIRFNRGQQTQEKLMSVAESMARYTMPALDFICDMEINGIKYDIGLNKKIGAKMVEEVSNLESLIFSAIGKELELDSGKVLGEFLYGEQGYTPPYKTKTGEPSTDGEALRELAKSTGLQWLADIGKRTDIVSVYRTFIRDYVSEHVKRDGRIHPSYNLNGTSSFRITGDNPNLTQLPREKHGYNVRECFTVDNGKLFLAFDFSSAEVKVLGALCRDPKLLQAIREGKDFHSFSAAAMYGIAYEDFIGALGDETHVLYKDYKVKRQNAKALTFGILYGSTARGVAFNMGITEEQAQALIDMYFKTYPLIEAYVKDAHAMALMNHFVVSPFMQRKWEFGARKEFRYTAVYNACKRNAQNVLIQNTASSLGLFCFTNLNREIKKLGGKTLCTVYDSVELEIPIKNAAKAVELAFYYMNEYPQEVFDWLDFPIGVDGEIGHNWGNLHRVEPGITQQQILKMIGH
jgi:DNA polymerase-1